MQIITNTQYLPPISTFQMMKEAHEVVIEGKETFQKKSYRNRCYIQGPNGIVLLSVPIQKGSSKYIQDIKIAYFEHWVNKHLQAIQTTYGKAPFFEFYFDDLTEIYQRSHVYLFDLNMVLLSWILEQIQIIPIIRVSQEYVSEYPETVMDIRHLDKNDPFIQNQPYQSYQQVFSDRFDFQANLSIIDLLFCKGPESYLYI